MLFQSTPSVGRATALISITSRLRRFQSTPSVGRATAGDRRVVRSVTGFQSTPSVGRATQPIVAEIIPPIISIHALRGEGDVGKIIPNTIMNISIHALRGEGDVDRAFL